ncbi:MULTISPECIES: amino acid ABC transporter permease [unclassified Rhizobium]|uniref:amino acid ABC transporter permease n=1 Tax=unclassified Rhizobium TaxID=2613769 RepID=UPI0006F3E593|nr:MULTISPECIES: amino acid ABC transporter permease [unclassified Rhizobium]KQV44497.1 amino acid ABC transporter permease [Rhizobium sp. Root1212]KRD38678.1 amino acid ABC transporter permease [Rhizobium sp. Root268]
MSFIRSIRPSNLVILAALPFIVYLFASSEAYQRSLRAILGVEQGSSVFVPGFLLLAIAFSAGFAVLVLSRMKVQRPRLTLAAGFVGLLATAAILAGDLVHPFIASVVANGVDAFKSDLVVKGATPRQLTEAADLMVRGVEAWIWPAYAVLQLAGLGLLFAGSRAEVPAESVARRAGSWLVGLVNGAGLAFVFLFAHIAFASGLATTIRAAIAAYILAAILGLVWVGLLKLRYSRTNLIVFVAMTFGFAALSTWFLLQPRDTYVLTGTLEGKIGIVTNTPSGLIGAVRFGQYEGGPTSETPVRTFVSPEQAIEAIGKKQDVSGALLPEASVPADWPQIWRTEALNDRDRAAGITLAVIAIATGLLTLGGYLHHRHPLSIGSEFIVDTIRGIPMLVIVLYVGLPLSGALKDATAGVFDPPNLIRGIVAMAIAYSAYLAEIFRSGINAIPVGQIEAAASVGLSRWQTARLVILPQAFRIVIPPLGNELIAILKDTSLLSILSIRDITQRMREFQSASFLPFAPYNSAAILYILLTLAAASFVSLIEKKYDVKHR